MNTPSPLIPQGSLQKQYSGKSNLRIAVFTIAAIHLVFIGGLLMQGCKRDTPPPAAADDDTNRFASFPPFNPDVAPPISQDLPPPPPARDEVELRPPNEREALPPPPREERPPQNGRPPAPDVQPEYTEYVVVSGDSFWSIAQTYGVTVRAIQQANPDVDAARLQIGQTLMIPPPAPARPTATANGAPVVENGITSYTVQAGDNLTRIAQRYNTTVARLRELNNLTTDRINVGQRLRVPDNGNNN